MGMLDNIIGSLTGGGEGQNQLLQLVTSLITQLRMAHRRHSLVPLKGTVSTK
jgi:hypothetical protein